MQIKKTHLLGGLVIAAAIGAMVWQATREGAVVTFYTPEEVYASPAKFENKTFRVSGLVLPGTKQWDGDSRHLRFRMSDLKGHEFTVHYNGVPPDLFKEGQGVIVEGKLATTANLKADNSFHSTLLMVKHSEVYDTTKDHSQLRESKVLDSMLKPSGATKQTMNSSEGL